MLPLSTVLSVSRLHSALRRVTTLFTMWGEYMLLTVRSSRPVQASVYLMVIGALIAAYYDFDFSLVGYVLVALNCFFTAAYLLAIAKFGKQGLNTFGLMYYNNIQVTAIRRAAVLGERRLRPARHRTSTATTSASGYASSSSPASLSCSTTPSSCVRISTVRWRRV